MSSDTKKSKKATEFVFKNRPKVTYIYYNQQVFNMRASKMGHPVQTALLQGKTRIF